MFSYSVILSVAKKILEDDTIPSNNLVMEYHIPEKQHKKLNEDLFYRMNEQTSEVEYTDIIEVEVENILFKFLIEKMEKNA
jgi:hypothetical protein